MHAAKFELNLTYNFRPSRTPRVLPIRARLADQQSSLLLPAHSSHRRLQLADAITMGHTTTICRCQSLITFLINMIFTLLLFNRSFKNPTLKKSTPCTQNYNKYDNKKKLEKNCIIFSFEEGHLGGQSVGVDKIKMIFVHTAIQVHIKLLVTQIHCSASQCELYYYIK